MSPGIRPSVGAFTGAVLLEPTGSRRPHVKDHRFPQPFGSIWSAPTGPEGLMVARDPGPSAGVLHRRGPTKTYLGRERALGPPHLGLHGASLQAEFHFYNHSGVYSP